MRNYLRDTLVLGDVDEVAFSCVLVHPVFTFLTCVEVFLYLVLAFTTEE